MAAQPAFTNPNEDLSPPEYASVAGDPDYAPNRPITKQSAVRP